ncbi:hypothetical protein GP486_002583 [Trichoglossum hirsutum]|uniref:Ribosomal protein S16 n=1 Tax=Trichoglossum hirsutum TaxID=265104 RepID=A0A9P8LEZ0_9PEZI|nr:hypothetical protein GP486_002583 [Trichoglossum hirsutum]
MVVRIRLARFGKRHAPFYNIVVAHARYVLADTPAQLFLCSLVTIIVNRTARNSKPIEVLGTYDPIPKQPPDGEGKPFKDIRLDSVRAKYWLGVGAQPSDPVWRLLSMIGLVEPRYRPGQQAKTAKSHAPSSDLREA